VNGPLIDVNVSLGLWPTRRTPSDTLPALFAKLSSHGVAEAWVGSFDGLFHANLAGVNARLAADCLVQTEVRLIPFGEINPLQSTWEDELRACVERHRMPGIRLHPNYHGYDLDHPEFARLLQAAAESKLIVSVAALMEDERMMHPLMRVPNVNFAPLADLVAKTAGLRLVLLNATKRSFRGVPLDRLMQAGEVYVEIAMLEGVGGVEKLLNEIPLDRLLFGSNAPSFYFESSLLKLQESLLSEAQLSAVSRDNARRLLAKT
jgi:uncharacterized protein